MPIFTVTIAFQASAETWDVSRACTVLETHDTYHGAIRGACEIAVRLRRQMYCDMRFRMCDAAGHGHVFISMNDTRSPAVLAERLLYMFGSGPAKPSVPHRHVWLFVSLAQVRAMAVHSARRLAWRRVPA